MNNDNWVDKPDSEGYWVCVSYDKEDDGEWVHLSNVQKRFDNKTGEKYFVDYSENNGDCGLYDGKWLKINIPINILPPNF